MPGPLYTVFNVILVDSNFSRTAKFNQPELWSL